MSASPSQEFDPTEPIAAGTTVLEASAGTGKTHAVSSIVVAEVAAGRPIDQMLVVTFTRKATGTLRERVWLRLVEAEAALDLAAEAPNDELLVHLRAGSAEVVDRRRRLVERALGLFDTASIETTHGFCQRMLSTLGVAGDAERDLTVVDDISDLVSEVVDDLLVRRFHEEGRVHLPRRSAGAIARRVIDNQGARVAQVDRDPDQVLRRRLALTARDQVTARKREARVLTYDDLLARLLASIEDPERGRVVVDRLRRRYSMAIVDEFQDTDSMQWEIFRQAFGGADQRLVLVGDPKQAIYAFRGGDVHAYLEATGGADRQRSLSTSWRADQPLLDGLATFFDGAELGDRAIVHRPLSARPGAEEPRLLGDDAAALTVRIIDRALHDGLDPQRLVAKPNARRLVAADTAAEAARLLSAGLQKVERDQHGVVSTHPAPRPLLPRDLAVLVRTKAEAELVRDAMLRAGVPAVFHGGRDVLTTDAARSWLTLLQAIEAPARVTGVHAAAIGPFVGWTPVELAEADDAAWDQLDEHIRSWSQALAVHGVSGLLRAIEVATHLSARVLATESGERQLSDLRHVAELLHAEQVARGASVATLAKHLADQIRDRTAAGRGDDEVGRRRLESDADAVSIQTIHGAKGLEFPVVLLPTLWAATWHTDHDPLVFHDDDGERSVCVGSSGPLFEAQRAAAYAEQRDEELRLLYVALTRAEHRVIAWWVAATDAHETAMARVLLKGEGNPVVPPTSSLPHEDAVAGALQAMADRTGASIGVERVGAPASTRLPRVDDDDADLSVARFDRPIDTSWARTSYSGLTAAADAPHAVVAFEVVEVDEEAKVDEPEAERADRPDAADPLAVVVGLSGLPGGTRVGTLVHEVLEVVDFTDPDVAEAVRRVALDKGADRIVPGFLDDLTDGVVAALATPLGPHWGDVTLTSVARTDRLDELGFDLPLAGGDQPVGRLTMDAIADVFATHLPVEDPLADYHERLRDPLLHTEVAGFLNGSIDLVLRVGERHVVVDYKTNHLGRRGEPLLAWHYRPEALAEAMAAAHYPLQAALYGVALHRYLRWRQPAYDPARHLGGVAYLFLRGMIGPDTPRVDGQTCGVLAWDPGPKLVLSLSDVLDRGAP